VEGAVKASAGWGLRRFFVHPAGISFVVHFLVVSAVILQAGGDPLALARLGTRYSQGDATGSEGYDGQFVYYIARDLDPQTVRTYLDVPAYRYQRILLPLLARGLSLGNLAAIPWLLAILGILTQTAGTWAVSRLLRGWGISQWYALVYGLWAGFLLAVRLDLSEPLAYGLVAGGFLAHERQKYWLSWILLSLSVFAKEVTAFFVLAALLELLSMKRWRDCLLMLLITGLPFALFQGWLWQVFGAPGIGSGGAMATPFEWIPFMGFFRIGQYSPGYLLAMLVVFGPSIIMPSVWGIWAGFRQWLAGESNVLVISLLLNALLMCFLPFSTVREPGGLLRFACGLILSVLLFAGRYHQKKVLNYSVLWVVMNAFLLKT